jgi:AcrR family transcriptional regulator
MGQNGYHHGNRPAALKQAVLDIVEEADISAVTMAEVARRAGVSPGAPDKHLEGLDDLIL